MPPLPGVNRQGVTNVRTLEDVQRILQTIGPGARCVCIGGGLLGLETAGAHARRGAEVTLIEGHGWLLPRQLTQQAGKRQEEHVARLGIRLRTFGHTAEILGDAAAHGVRLEDGSVLPADLVVIATGIHPNTYLARRAGLEFNQGVVVNSLLQCSHPGVYAAEHRGVAYGTWGASQYQGNFHFVFHDSFMVGAVLMGDTAVTAAVKKSVEQKTDFSGLLSKHPTTADVRAHLSEGNP